MLRCVNPVNLNLLGISRPSYHFKGILRTVGHTLSSGYTLELYPSRIPHPSGSTTSDITRFGSEFSVGNLKLDTK